MNNNYDNYDQNVSVSPPESLVKYDLPLFVGVETVPGGTYAKPTLSETTSKLDDMVNSMLPARYLTPL